MTWRIEKRTARSWCLRRIGCDQQHGYYRKHVALHRATMLNLAIARLEGP